MSAILISHPPIINPCKRKRDFIAIVRNYEGKLCKNQVLWVWLEFIFTLTRNQIFSDKKFPYIFLAKYTLKSGSFNNSHLKIFRLLGHMYTKPRLHHVPFRWAPRPSLPRCRFTCVLLSSSRQYVSPENEGG